MKKLLNNRGSMIVEGAMVIPIILIISISAIYLVMDFYVDTVSRAVEDAKVFEKGFEESQHIRQYEFMKVIPDEK